ncbi:MAG: NifU family protein [Myxococcota bacterium]|nr:NifU family protein [Myxococcota bacterium]
MSWMDRIKGGLGFSVATAVDDAAAPEHLDPVASEVAEESESAAWLEVEIDPPAAAAVTCPVRFGRPVSPGGTSLFETPEEAAAWPAVRALLGVQGVHSIIGKGEVLVVARHASTKWSEILPAIEPALRTAFEAEGEVHVARPPSQEVAAPPAEPAGSEDSDSEAVLRTRVASIIEEQINPAVAAHGGYIDLLDVQGSRVFIHMGGGCQGCSMSAATLKHGVETTLRSEIPEITEILDTTDHAAGANPYFQA